MTQPQTLNVEYAELIARANEIEELLPPIPSTNPQAPCALSMAADAVTQLGLSADSIRLYLKGCEREWKNLAKSLRNAAKAYEEVDEGAADAMNDEGRMSASVSPVSASGESDMPFEPPAPRSLSAPADDSYYEVRQATMAIENGDQGATCKAFAQEWHSFQFKLQKVADRFRPFTAWEGDARTAVEQNFELQRQWISSMVQLCCKLRDQANDLVEAQEKIRAASGTATQDDSGNYVIPEEHPGPGDIAFVENTYQAGVDADMQGLIQTAMEWYAILQKKSETALKFYRDKTALPPLDPPMFPTAAPAAEAVDNASGISDGIDRGNLVDGLTDGLSDLPATGLPSLPTGGLPSLPSMSPGGAAAKVPPLPASEKGLPKGAQVKPASLGGSGVGVPSLPKPTWAGAGTPSGAAAAAPSVGSGKVPVPAAYAALNGGAGAGGMGGMPMGGAGGQGQGAGKAKRVQTEDAALYTEDRAWTEGVIGRRRAS